MVYSNHRMSARTTNSYKNHRVPSKIIAHAVWLYYRFSLSFREVQELLAERLTLYFDIQQPPADSG